MWPFKKKETITIARITYISKTDWKEHTIDIVLQGYLDNGEIYRCYEKLGDELYAITSNETMKLTVKEARKKGLIFNYE